LTASIDDIIEKVMFLDSRSLENWPDQLRFSDSKCAKNVRKSVHMPNFSKNKIQKVTLYSCAVLDSIKDSKKIRVWLSKAT
jgi:hypothetical protein